MTGLEKFSKCRKRFEFRAHYCIGKLSDDVWLLCARLNRPNYMSCMSVSPSVRLFICMSVRLSPTG